MSLCLEQTAVKTVAGRQIINVNFNYIVPSLGNILLLPVQCKITITGQMDIPVNNLMLVQE